MGTFLLAYENIKALPPLNLPVSSIPTFARNASEKRYSISQGSCLINSLGITIFFMVFLRV
jgi:hypothetical protein